MRKLVITLCVLAQAAVLIYMVAGRELILNNGQQVYLKTAPLDPRDIFRGDFVRLDYAINNLSMQQFKGAEATAWKKGQQVYARLDEGAGGIHRLADWSDSRPESGLFIKGRLTSRFNPGDQQLVRTKYGIEQYYVEQGAGLVIEEQRGRRGELQVPMEVRVAIGKNGTAVLKDYRWGKMGIELEVMRSQNNPGPAEDNLPPPVSPTIRITLKNVSDQPLMLYNPGDNCAFSLVVANTHADNVSEADTSCAGMPYDDAAEILLQPDEQHQIEFDFSQPRWHLQTEDSSGTSVTGEMGEVEVSRRFRLIYRSPESRDAFWQGELASQAFSPRGWVD